MSSARSMGRTIGALLFLQLVGLSLPFILLQPATASGFLEDAAGLAVQTRVAVFLLFANAALTIGIAIAAWPFFRERSQRMALWLLSLSVIWFAIQAVDNAHILSMLSLSQRFAEGGASDGELLGALAAMLRSTRRWVHYTELLVIDAWFLVFYGLLLRFSLVPRALAGFGVLAVIVHTAAIPMPIFLGYASIQPLGFSLALSHLALGTWLVVKGFEARHP